MPIKRPNTAPKKSAKRYAPYIMNPLPAQVEAITSEWRRQNANSVDTEVIKPESLLPVTTGSAGRSPICFTIKSIPHTRVDGNNIYLETTFNLQKLVGSTWSNVGTTDEVMPVANTYCSIFEDLTVAINGVMAENSQREFAISRYLQNVLFTTNQDRTTWMTEGLLALSKANPNYVAEAADLAIFPGTAMRRGVVEHDKPVTLYGKLLSNVLSCSEPLPDNVEITIKLFPAKSEACIVSQDKPTAGETKTVTDADGKTTTTASTAVSDYRIQITDCALYVPRITTKTSPNVDKAFSFTNWKTLAYTHQSGQTNFKKDIAIGETLPQKAIVVFQTEKGYNGDWELSKLAFGPQNVANVLMKCNQRHLPFINGYACEFGTVKNYHTAYTGLVTELGARHHAIPRATFHNNFAIFGFDCTPNKTGDISMGTRLKGALELSVTFETAPTENLIVLVLLIHDGKFVISKNGSFNQL